MEGPQRIQLGKIIGNGKEAAGMASSKTLRLTVEGMS